MFGESITEYLFISKERFYEIKKQFGAPQKGDVLLSSVGNRSGVPYLVKASAGLDIALPPLSTQRRIASILSALDDKIELNRQTNQTLEAIAQAIYKEWFVDFRFPHSPLEGNKCEMQDSELGSIPKGWMVKRLGDIGNITMGQSPSDETYNASGEGISFYQGNRDFGFRFPSQRIYCIAPTRIAETGDILISVRAPVGALNIALDRCAIGRGVAALRMVK